MVAAGHGAIADAWRTKLTHLPCFCRTTPRRTTLLRASQGSNDYLTGDELTFADIELFCMLSNLRSGFLDGGWVGGTPASREARVCVGGWGCVWQGSCTKNDKCV